MPAFASKKQYRMMMAILHGKSGTTSRGDKGPPKSVAEKYSGSGKDLPEDKGKAHRGGKWDSKAGKRHKEKHKKKLEKSTGGAAVIVVNDKGQLLMGRQVKDDYRWSFPGGHVEDGESHKDAAVRELEEETGVKIDKDLLKDLYEDGKDRTYVVRLDHTPAFRATPELSDVGFYDIDDIDFNKLRDCCVDSMVHYLKSRLTKTTKSIKDLLQIEHLESLSKERTRPDSESNVVYEFAHHDALRLIGNGVFRMLKRSTEGMGADQVRDIQFGNYMLHVRKHSGDTYSGRIDDGLKTVHQFVNRSLSEVASELMSVFEWHDDENDKNSKFEVDDESNLPDHVIEDGIRKLVDNYRSYNIADIYDEMESIREEIRHGNAVDLQQIENRVTGLFDKLEERMEFFKERHNSLASKIGDEIDDIEKKLVTLQDAIDKMSKKPSKVEAFSADPADPREVFSEYYAYLSKPRVSISPTGHITIDFGSDWMSGDRENFLKDMRAKVVKKSKK